MFLFVNRPERSRTEHPIVAVLREQGRSQSWLARRIGRSHEHTNRVLNGVHPAVAEFRAACALALGMPESSLFHGSSDVSTPADAPNDGSDDGAGIAVASSVAVR